MRRNNQLLKYMNEQHVKQQARLEDKETGNEENRVKIHRGRLGLPEANDFISWLKIITFFIIVGIILYAIFI